MIIKKYSLFETLKDTPFYIFGSENSQDYDVLVAVDYIPDNINEASDICKAYNVKLSKILTDKPLNCNIGVFNDDTLTDVYKGTVDELINCLYYTYNNHKQFYPNPIKYPSNRDINEKILRVARFLITFYSRTTLRTKIKAALRGDLKQKLSVLKEIDYVEMTDFPGKDEKKEDIYKVVAFQLGQLFSLIDGKESESYSKTEIAKNYPDLENLLTRKAPSKEDFQTLNKYLKMFTDLIESNIEKLRLTEQ